MAANVPNHPGEAEEPNAETRRIIDERLRTLDEDIKTAVPLKQLTQESRARLMKFKKTTL